MLRRKKRSARKRPASALGAQVGVGGGDHADVDVARGRGADALEFAGLEHAQQLRLLAERNVGDLVEEERAAVGEFEATDAVGARVGEGALDVAEELALEGALGERAGVDGDERAAARAARDDAGVCATTSLPVPCSPVMRTFASDGPMRAISSTTGRMQGAVAISSGAPSARRMRFSASSHCARFCALCSSICVRRTVSRRALSQGFWMKSRAPRRMASTARSMLAHAVITMMGSCESLLADAREQVEALAPRGGVAGVVQVDENTIDLLDGERLQDLCRTACREQVEALGF